MGFRKTMWTLALSMLLSAVLTTIFLCGLAFVMLKLEPDQRKMEIGIFCTYLFSCFAAGWYCGKRKYHRKYLWGILAGLLYFLILFIISSFGNTSLYPSFARNIFVFLLCVMGGMAGGMIA